MRMRVVDGSPTYFQSFVNIDGHWLSSNKKDEHETIINPMLPAASTILF
jgi:hypothetical protein